VKLVVDTRFFIEHFYSKDPQVHNKTKLKLERLIEAREGLVPTIVLAEIAKVTCEKRGREEAQIRHSAVDRSGLKIVELSAEAAKEAGLLKCKYRDAPIGDCIIASVAIATKANVLTDDPHIRKMKEVKTAWI